MEIIDRVKNVLVTPKTEWTAIEAENMPHAKVFTTYVVPLALIPAVASLIGYGFFRVSAFGIYGGSLIALGVRHAIMQYALMIGGVYVTAFVIDALADNFGVKKDFDRAFSLVAYSYTPMFVAGALYMLPTLAGLATLAGLYGLYLLYIGLQPMMKVTDEKQTSYFVVSLVVMIVALVVLSAVLKAVLLRGIW